MYLLNQKFMTSIFIIVLFVVFSAGQAFAPVGESVSHASAVAAETVQLGASDVQLKWSGSKVTGDGHHGTLKIQSGNLKLNEKGQITGGGFVIDMNSLRCEDLKPGEGKEKLEGHLKAEDFFYVEKHPTAKFDIVSATSKGDGKYQINGKLTVRGKTHPISFPAEITVSKKMVKAEANFAFDRTKYGVMFHSKEDASWWDQGKAELKDQVISNDVTLEISLKARR